MIASARALRFADAAREDRSLCRLQGTTEERVGRAGHAKSSPAGLVQQQPCVAAAGGEGLLTPDVLAAREDPGRYVEVGGGDGEVQRDLDVVVGQELVDEQVPQPELPRTSTGALLVEVRYRDHVQIREPRQVLEVVAADDAGADDADTHSLGVHRSTSTR
ncbi:hypothetical protein [Streptomyces sp. YU58]|uniref:hypothetical protein n=1 Tax=Streptomyces sp. SX92 TaxID=3158972 RepID=UPI0027BA210A|nr:hypothetical protein [Streptomyces coralus]WLW57924.1 hypothetical protein QU709_44045 [Streptomyces coralus]